MTFSKATPVVDLPCPLAMADSMDVLESWPRFALVMAMASLELKVGSGPPSGLVSISLDQSNE